MYVEPSRAEVSHAQPKLSPSNAVSSISITGWRRPSTAPPSIYSTSLLADPVHVF